MEATDFENVIEIGYLFDFDLKIRSVQVCIFNTNDLLPYQNGFDTSIQSQFKKDLNFRLRITKIRWKLRGQQLQL